MRAAELILLGQAFDAVRAAELGFVTRVIPDARLLTTATETAQNLAQKPASALQTCKRLMKWSTRQQVEDAMRAENDEFAARVRSPEGMAAMMALVEKQQQHSPTGTTQTRRVKKAS